MFLCFHDFITLAVPSCEVWLFSDPNSLEDVAICGRNVTLYCLANNFSGDIFRWFINDMVLAIKPLPLREKLPIVLIPNESFRNIRGLFLTLDYYTDELYLESTLTVITSFFNHTAVITPLFNHAEIWSFKCGFQSKSSNRVTLNFRTYRKSILLLLV